MDLATRKYNFIQELTSVDESLLEKLELFLKANQKDWYEELSPEEKNEIESGLQEANNGELISHEKIMDKFKKWH